MNIFRLMAASVAILLFAQCGRSSDKSASEEKDIGRVEKLIAETTKKNLFYPESYDPVEMSVDSLNHYAFSAENIAKAKRIKEVVGELGIINGRFYGSDNVVRRHYKEEFKELVIGIMEDMDRPDSFQGWIVYNKFRAEDKNRNTTFGEVYYVLNPEKTEVMFGIGVEDPDFKTFSSTMEAIGQSKLESVKSDNDILLLAELLRSNYHRSWWDQ